MLAPKICSKCQHLWKLQATVGGNKHICTFPAVSPRFLAMDQTSSGYHIVSAPAAEKNKDVILQVLKQHISLDQNLFALEIASGCGLHVDHFANSLPNVTWQPSDVDQDSMNSVRGRIAKNRLTNVLAPEYIDVSRPVGQWDACASLKQRQCDLIFSVNLVHITHMEAVVGLFRAAGELLKPGAILFTYGPYKENGLITPDSNVRFDQMLRSRDSGWGLRDINDLKALAQENGMALENKIDVPSNNKVLIFRKLSK